MISWTRLHIGKQLNILTFYYLYVLGVSIDNPCSRKMSHPGPDPVMEECEVNYDPNATNDKSGRKLRKMKSLESGKESLKHIRQEFKDLKKEVKAEIKEQVKHLPDGHRGSIASITERPPYRPIPKQPKESEEKQ